MSAQSQRLPKGGLIDRSKPISFRFDGKTYQGYEGDTLASALLANGVQLVGRSFKYHRPRGVYTAGPEEPNALVRMREGARAEPNTRATMVELYDGLIARSQNRWPSLRVDLQSINSLMYRIKAGSEQKLKETGLIRTEGKEYIVQPDDVLLFRFNVSTKKK